MGSFPKPISNEGSNSSFQCGILNMPLKMGPLWICHSWIRFQFVFRLNIHLSFIGYDTMLDTYGVLSQNPLTMRDVIHLFYKDCVVSSFFWCGIDTMPSQDFYKIKINMKTAVAPPPLEAGGGSSDKFLQALVWTMFVCFWEDPLFNILQSCTL